ALTFALAACGSPSQRTILSTRGYRAFTDPSGLHIQLGDGGTLDPPAGEPQIAWAGRTPTVVSFLGQFGFTDGTNPYEAAGALDAGSLRPGGVGTSSTLALAGGGSVTLTALDDWTLGVDIASPPDAGFDRVALAFACGSGDHFLGFGEQTNALDQRGLAFGLWTMEDGIGKHPGATHTGGYDPAGDTNDSYFPMPSFIDPRGFGLTVDTTARVETDLCAADSTAWRIDAWEGSLALRLVFGQTPRDLVSRLTALTGRPPLAAPWTYGVWADSYGGEARLQTVATELRQNKIPCSAIWTEDWEGHPDGGTSLDSWGWTPDETLYPGFSAQAASLHAEGFKWLGYFNTFVRPGSPEWEQGVAQGTLVGSPDGGPYLFVGPSLEPTALVDLTNPAARQWMGTAMESAAQAGLDGWMADFGEWLPWDAQLADGTSGAVAHNRYPLLWAGLNQTVAQAVAPTGDFVYFVRSGWAGQPALTPAVWPGDQNTDWGTDDGLPSVLPMAENLSLQGVAAWGSDIGGFSTFLSPPTTKELFLRWAEVGAYSPVMRTHHGSDPTQSWHFDSDAETLQIFGQYAREHLRLFPYLYTQATQATQTGLGILRPIWVDFPTDPASLGLTDEYLLGDSLLVAPIVTQGATSRSVHFPAGVWLAWRTADSETGPTDVTVQAALDQLPVYSPAGAVLPILTDDVDTVAPSADPAVKSLAQAGAELGVRAFLGADGSFTSYDGTTLVLHSAPGDAPTSLASCVGAAAACPALPSCSNASPPCGDIDGAARLATAQLSGADVTLAAGAATLEVRSPVPRAVSIQLRY
ncbi:MAG: TIM-barrel domain-containing protein, partial [Deltaproteobacteria bacterium]